MRTGVCRLKAPHSGAARPIFFGSIKRGQGDSNMRYQTRKPGRPRRPRARAGREECPSLQDAPHWAPSPQDAHQHGGPRGSSSKRMGDLTSTQIALSVGEAPLDQQKNSRPTRSSKQRRKPGPGLHHMAWPQSQKRGCAPKRVAAAPIKFTRRQFDRCP